MDFCAIPCPVELEKEEDYAAITQGLFDEACALLVSAPQSAASDFIRLIGYRRWMSNFADYWNIPEDEELDRREVAHIDRYLKDVFNFAREHRGEK